jgi:hypothetical protein
MKKLLFLLALVIAAGFIACEDPNNSSAEKDTYTISFNANGGSGGPDAVSAAYGQALPALDAGDAPARTGYDFAGYSDAASGGTVYYNADLTSAKNWDKKENAALYAVWTAKTYAVSFDNTGGTGGPDAVSAIYGQPMPEITAAPASDARGFAGYFDAASDGKKYYNADLTSAADWDKDGNSPYTLYAQWVSGNVITFNANGGAGGQTAPVNAIFGQPMPSLGGQAPVNEDSSSGYVKYYFDGYWDTVSGGNKYYNADLTSAVNWDKAENTELFARWLTVAQKYNITLGMDDITAWFVEAPPVIDGTGGDAAWSKANWQDIKYAWMYTSPKSLPTGATVNLDGTIPKTDDFSGRFKVVWTADRLYILAEIIDDIIYTPITSTTQSPEKNDCLEMFIDEDASGGTRATGGNNFFTYHMNFDGINVVDYVASTSQNILRNSHLNYKIDKNDAAHTYIWETEMKVYDNTYPLATTPDNVPVTLTDGKKLGLAVAYCDNDNNAHSSSTAQIGDRDHFIGSMFVTGNTDNDRNVAYQNSTQYAKLYLVK